MIEYQTARIVQWLEKRDMVRFCPLCASGLRVTRKGFWHWVHPVVGEKGKTQRCKNPSWWIYLEGQRSGR